MPVVRLDDPRQGWTELTSRTRLWVIVVAFALHQRDPRRGPRSPVVAKNNAELAADNTVNTMPEKTLAAVAEHGTVASDAVTGHYADAAAALDELARVGISYSDVVQVLEDEGVDNFEKSWGELLDGVRSELEKASA